jgi:thymidylate synthase
MIQTFAGSTADELWLDVADSLLHAPTQSGRGGGTKELLHVGLSLSNPRARWISVRRPAINPAFALVEVLWILLGRQDAALPTFWNPLLPKFAGEGPTFHGAYGWRLRRHFEVDQLERAVAALRANPSTRQITLQIWDPAIDLPSDSGLPVSADVPCNTASHLKVRRGRLDWLQIMRSNDIFLGTPHNFVQFSILQEIVAGRLGLELGSYDVVVDSLHLYDRDIQHVCDSLDSVPIETDMHLPRFTISTEEWEATVHKLAHLVDFARTTADSSRLAAELETAHDLPSDWPSAVAVIYADAARRLKYGQLADRALDYCTNVYLRELYRRWDARVSTSTLKQVAG